MCFGGANVPDTSTELKATEAERAARVQATSDKVNTTFDKKFGPQYYKGLGDSFRDYYRPQIQTQFNDARRATTLRQADNANSSAANRETAGLYKTHANALQDVESGAFDTVNQAKQDVEGKRGQLISLAEAGSSLENTAAQARAAAGADIGRQPYSPLGDVFSQYANTISTAANRGDNGLPVNPFYQKQVDFLRGRKAGGSSSVIG